MKNCPTCGGAKKWHSDRLWKMHAEMWKAFKKAQAATKRVAEKGRKE